MMAEISPLSSATPNWSLELPSRDLIYRDPGGGGFRVGYGTSGYDFYRTLWKPYFPEALTRIAAGGMLSGQRPAPLIQYAPRFASLAGQPTSDVTQPDALDAILKGA